MFIRIFFLIKRFFIQKKPFLYIFRCNLQLIALKVYKTLKKTKTRRGVTFKQKQIKN